MTNLISALKAQDEINVICQSHAINLDLLKKFFYFSMKGYNNAEIAKKIGCHRITVQRYTATLKKMKELEFKKLIQHLAGGK